MSGVLRARSASKRVGVFVDSAVNALRCAAEVLCGRGYRPILIAGRAGGLVGRSATADDVGLWLAECGFDAEIRIEGAFAYASARRG